MDQVTQQNTQQNAALAEQAPAASSAMQDQAGQLLRAVSVFKLAGTEQAAAARPARPVSSLRPQLA